MKKIESVWTAFLYAKKIDTSFETNILSYYTLNMATASTHSHFHDLTETLNGNDLTFVTHHVPLCIVNGIRRYTMNAIPIAGFRDEPPALTDTDARSIVIRSNNSLLYNEMLVTRIAMLPIHQSKVPRILSTWSSDTNQRDFRFERPDEIPICE